MEKGSVTSTAPDWQNGGKAKYRGRFSDNPGYSVCDNIDHRSAITGPSIKTAHTSLTRALTLRLHLTSQQKIGRLGGINPPDLRTERDAKHDLPGVVLVEINQNRHISNNNMPALR